MIALLVGVLCLIFGYYVGVYGMLKAFKGKAESGNVMEMGGEIWRLVKVETGAGDIVNEGEDVQ